MHGLHSCLPPCCIEPPSTNRRVCCMHPHFWSRTLKEAGAVLAYALCMGVWCLLSTTLCAEPNSGDSPTVELWSVNTASFWACVLVLCPNYAAWTKPAGVAFRLRTLAVRASGVAFWVGFGDDFGLKGFAGGPTWSAPQPLHMLHIFCFFFTRLCLLQQHSLASQLAGCRQVTDVALCASPALMCKTSEVGTCIS